MANLRIKITPITPHFYPEEVFLKVGKEIEKQVDIQERMYRKTYATWSHKPSFKRINFTFGHKELYGQISTSDRRYIWIDAGTSRKRKVVRRNKPDSRWSPKTKKRVIGSSAGRPGNLVPIKVWTKGIVAREFTDEIVRRRQKYVQDALAKAVSKGLEKAWKGRWAK